MNYVTITHNYAANETQYSNITYVIENYG